MGINLIITKVKSWDELIAATGGIAMSVNLILTNGSETHVSELCTTGGYSGLVDWLGELPEADYPSLREFARIGFFVGTDRLVRSLDAALLDAGPADPDTRKVANRLADLMGDGYSEESASVTE